MCPKEKRIPITNRDGHYKDFCQVHEFPFDFTNSKAFKYIKFVMMRSSHYQTIGWQYTIFTKGIEISGSFTSYFDSLDDIYFHISIFTLFNIILFILFEDPQSSSNE